MLTLTVQGELDEVRAVILGLFTQAPSISASISPAAPTQPEQSIPTEPWTFDQFSRYWERLQPNPRRFFLEVARHEDGCHADIIKQELNWTYRQLAGVLTGPTALLKRFPGKPPIYTRGDYTNGYTYNIGVDIRAFIQRLNP